MTIDYRTQPVWVWGIVTDRAFLPVGFDFLVKLVRPKTVARMHRTDIKCNKCEFVPMNGQ